MTAGIEIINTAGTTLIDENYSNIAMRAKGSLTLTDISNPITFPFLNGGMKKPVIAIRVTNGVAGIRSATNNSATGTSTMQIAGSIGANVNWYLFDFPSVTSNAGLQIFNGSGQLTFDSGNKYARVVDYWTATSHTQWNGTTKYYTDSRVYATAFISPWAYTNGTSSTKDCGGSRKKWALSYEAQVCQITSGMNNTTFSRFTFREDGLFGECITYDPRNRKTDCAIAVIDVTGY